MHDKIKSFGNSNHFPPCEWLLASEADHHPSLKDRVGRDLGSAAILLHLLLLSLLCAAVCRSISYEYQINDEMEIDLNYHGFAHMVPFRSISTE